MLSSIIQDSTIEETLAKDSIAPLSLKALDRLFLNARTHHAWQDRPVTDLTLRNLYDLVKRASTSVNGSPIRILFIKSLQEKAN
jgi:3-hydroxypropanoate dehydrogenase